MVHRATCTAKKVKCTITSTTEVVEEAQCTNFGWNSYTSLQLQYTCTQKIYLSTLVGTSVVHALPLAAWTNKGGHF